MAKISARIIPIKENKTVNIGFRLKKESSLIPPKTLIKIIIIISKARPEY